MPKIDNMQLAIPVATEWVAKYHGFRQVRGSKKDVARGVWRIDFAVGRDSKGKASVCLDAETGEVVEYDSSI